MLFQPEFLILGRSVISLRAVESMEFPDGEDITAERLRNDREIRIVMCSGKEYTISTRAQFADTDCRVKQDGIDAARQAIYDKWKHILTGKVQ